MNPRQSDPQIAKLAQTHNVDRFRCGATALDIVFDQRFALADQNSGGNHVFVRGAQ